MVSQRKRGRLIPNVFGMESPYLLKSPNKGIYKKGANKKMEQKIHNAIAYVEAMHGAASKAIRNDAANIFAGTFDEYMLIWDALDDLFGEVTE